MITGQKKEIITSDYGPRSLLGFKFHNGVDLRSWGNGKRLLILLPLECIFSEEVLEEKWGYTYKFQPTTGPADEIRFTHLRRSENLIPGVVYHAGHPVGETMRTKYMILKDLGEHLHFSTWKNGKHFDPKIFFEKIGVEWEYAK